MSARLELMAPVTSNIACFRYVNEGLSEDDLEKLNRNIFAELGMSNFGNISDTVIKGKHMLRACNVNHKSRIEDFDFLIGEIKRIRECARFRGEQIETSTRFSNHKTRHSLCHIRALPPLKFLPRIYSSQMILMPLNMPGRRLTHPHLLMTIHKVKTPK